MSWIIPIFVGGREGGGEGGGSLNFRAGEGREGSEKERVSRY